MEAAERRKEEERVERGERERWEKRRREKDGGRKRKRERFRADVAAMVTGVTLERNRTEPLWGKTRCTHTHEPKNSSNNHKFIYVN